MLRRFLSQRSRPAEPMPACPPPAANENLPLLPAGADPAAALARVRRYLALMRQENTGRGTLLADPRRRRDWEECRALERALVWRYFERR